MICSVWTSDRKIYVTVYDASWVTSLFLPSSFTCKSLWHTIPVKSKRAELSFLCVRVLSAIKIDLQPVNFLGLRPRYSG